MFKEILDGARCVRSHLFWKYVRKQNEAQKVVTPQKTLTHDDLNTAAESLFCVVPHTSIIQREQRLPSGIQTTLQEITEVVQRMKRNSASGLDNMSLQIMKSLGKHYWSFLVRIFNSVFNGDPVPESWRISKVTLIPKPEVDNDNLANRRPLTISTISYRIFMSIFKDRLADHMQTSRCIGSWQCGFRQDYRIDDHIFVMTQIIEISRKLNIGCYAAFLDIKKAYDSVDRDLLYRLLLEDGVDSGWVDLLKEIYSDCRIRIRVGKAESLTYQVVKGLRQGCPASPILFLYYIERVARCVFSSGLGWRFGEGEQSLRIPILMFADDIVLLATTQWELRDLLDIAGQATSALKLSFNPRKSAVLIFHGAAIETDVLIQGQLLPIAKEYKYLGICLNTGENYVKTDNCYRIQLAERGNAVVKMRSLWTFNRYIVTRNLWKTVIVPGITYGNAVIVRDRNTEAQIERCQRDTIRMSLGCRFTCCKEFLEGEGAMSTFREREAKSKLLYWLRLKEQDGERWASKLHQLKLGLNVKTKWDRKVEFLARQLGFNKDKWENSDLTESEVKELVKKKFEELWQRSMQMRTSLSLYRQHKTIKGHVDRLYDNSRGSGLMADARAGMLNTQQHRSHFLNVNTLCRLCGSDVETIDHVVLKCVELGVRNVPLSLALGMGQRRNYEEVYLTKSRLSEWEARISRLKAKT